MTTPRSKHPPSIAIIGTRDPDRYQVKAAYSLSWTLSRHFDATIHTGAADGIDYMAMIACKTGLLRVYLPWDGYNHSSIPSDAVATVYEPKKHNEWTESLRLHPSPNLSRGAKCLHARNYGIVYGRDLVVAFPQADGGGGTAQGIRIAEELGVPVVVRRSLKEFDWEHLWLEVASASRIVPF